MKELQLFLTIAAATFVSIARGRDGDIFLKVCERGQNVWNTTKGNYPSYQVQYFMKYGRGKAFHLKCLDGSSTLRIYRPTMNKYGPIKLTVKKGYDWVDFIFQTFNVNRLFNPDYLSTPASPLTLPPIELFDSVNKIRPMLMASGRNRTLEVYANAFEILPDYCLPNRYACSCNYCNIIEKPTNTTT